VQRAEVCLVSYAIGRSKEGPEYRYLAKREVIVEQRELPGMEPCVSYGGIKRQEVKSLWHSHQYGKENDHRSELILYKNPQCGIHCNPEVI
jgi:hypothetical protein